MVEFGLKKSQIMLGNIKPLPEEFEWQFIQLRHHKERGDSGMTTMIGTVVINTQIGVRGLSAEIRPNSLH